MTGRVGILRSQIAWLDTGSVSLGVHYVGRTSEDHRPLFLSVLTVDSLVVATDVTLKGGAFGSADPAPMLETLVSFLSAWDEAVRYGNPDSDNRNLFTDDWLPVLDVLGDLELEVSA